MVSRPARSLPKQDVLFLGCSTVIQDSPRLLAVATRLVVGGWWLLTGACSCFLVWGKCFEACGRHKQPCNWCLQVLSSASDGDRIVPENAVLYQQPVIRSGSQTHTSETCW